MIKNIWCLTTVQPSKENYHLLFQNIFFKSSIQVLLVNLLRSRILFISLFIQTLYYQGRLYLKMNFTMSQQGFDFRLSGVSILKILGRAKNSISLKALVYISIHSQIYIDCLLSRHQYTESYKVFVYILFTLRLFSVCRGKKVNVLSQTCHK